MRWPWKVDLSYKKIQSMSQVSVMPSPVFQHRFKKDMMYLVTIPSLKGIPTSRQRSVQGYQELRRRLYEDARCCIAGMVAIVTANMTDRPRIR